MRIIYIPKPKATLTSVKYGLLYNWFTAVDSRSIVSDGWHIPAYTELQTLIANIGADTVPAMGTNVALPEPYWESPFSTPTNTTKFNAYPSGFRVESGAFNSIHTVFGIWSSTSYDTNNGRYIAIVGSSCAWAGTDSVHGKRQGKSIRPVKDSTTLTNGQSGTYTDPSGLIYPTICIGTQEWAACNVVTRHYKNGDPILEITSNAEWTALTTSGCCAYNNDNSNI